MTEYQSPKAVTEGNNPEGVYMASGGTPPPDGPSNAYVGKGWTNQ